jgi:hypothetical protein
MNPYQVERKELIDRLISQYPYGRKWFETKSNHVLIALLKKAGKASNKSYKRN